MTQNIFDNDTFFKEYMDLRFHKKNLNDLIEQPQMKRLLPEIKIKRFWISAAASVITV